MADAVNCGDALQRIFSGTSIGDTANLALESAGEEFIYAQGQLDTWADEAFCEDTDTCKSRKHIERADKPPLLTRQPGQEIPVYYKGAVVHLKVTWYEAS